MGQAVRLGDARRAHPHSRAAGRTGLGALPGAKRLKAIAVRGTPRAEYPDASALRALVRQLNQIIRAEAAAMSRFGPSGEVAGAERFGDLPLQNWRQGSWPEGADAISGQTLHGTIWTKNTFCYACPIGCGKTVEVKEGPYTPV